MNDTTDRHAIIAYLATLAAIVLLAVTGAVVCIFGNYSSEVNLARVIGALGFLGTAATGLIGVIGTFRPKGAPTSTASTQSGDVRVEAKQ